MHEFEVRLHVPTPRLAAVRSALERGTVRRVRLQAAYFDTAEAALARNFLGLRLRREGSRWVQTLKCGSDPVNRLEHEVPLSLARGESPTIDPARHDGTPAGEALRAALGPITAADLHTVFATDIRRITREQRVRGARIELALDVGRIEAAGESVAVCELELELLGGSPAAALAAAARWASANGLWLDVRTKASRGMALAHGLAAAPATRSRPVALSAGMTTLQAWRSVLRSCVEQILGNSSEVAAGGYGPEHVHQLRVGLRRLRTAMALFDGWVDMPAHWRDVARDLFGALGATRDRDAFEADVLPALRTAGSPEVDWFGPAAGAAVPRTPASSAEVQPADGLIERLRDPVTTAFWLDLLRAVHAPADERPNDAQRSRKALVDAQPSDGHQSDAQRADAEQADAGSLLTLRIERWHRRLRRDGESFGAASDDERHTLRKRAKRLRYALEFTAALWPQRELARQLEALRLGQDALGWLSDLNMALPLVRARAQHDPQAWFAVGWIVAEREHAARRCAKALRQWRKAGRIEPV